MSKPQLVEAVMFFDEQGAICKQMFYTEFETLLDGLVKMPVFADNQIRAAFVTINGQLQIRSAVFFYLDFDESGAPDSGWNIPLQQLAERAGRGPDLGGGPIRLACRSQCPVSWHQMHLWDPNLTAVGNHMALLRDAAMQNNLGILVQADSVQAVDTERLQVASEEQWYAAETSREVAQKLTEQLAQDYRKKAAHLVRQQRERLEQLSREQQAELTRLKTQSGERVRAQQLEIQALRQSLRQQEMLAQGLKKQLAEQQRQLQGERDELTLRVHAAERHARTERDILRTQFDEELRARLAASELAVEQRLQLRDAEATQRGAGQVLQRLVSQGVVFVVYHPGAGHLTVPLQDVERYLNSPIAYVASKCFVSEQHYRQWLEHYQRPRCNGRHANGERCESMLERVETPGRFAPGDSDCCALHKSTSRLRTA